MPISQLRQRGIPFLIFLFSPLFLIGAENYIQMTRPTAFRQSESDVTLEGTVDLDPIRRVRVEVEPFLPVSESGPRNYEWPVTHRTFQGTVQFFPGINLVSLGTPGGSTTSRYAFVLPLAREGDSSNWGDAGTVAWTEPQALRHSQARIEVAGLVGGPAQTVDIITLTEDDLAAMDPHSDTFGTRLTFDRVNLKEGRFKTTVTLSPGANILLARPGPGNASRATTGLRTVFLEPQGGRVSLEEPLLAQGRLFLRGLSKRGPVQVTLTASVRTKKDALLRQHILWEEILTPGADGVFETNVSLRDMPAAAQVQGFPLVTAQAGKDQALRVVVGWKAPK